MVSVRKALWYLGGNKEHVPSPWAAWSSRVLSSIKVVIAEHSAKSGRLFATPQEQNDWQKLIDAKSVKLDASNPPEETKK